MPKDKMLEEIRDINSGNKKLKEQSALYNKYFVKACKENRLDCINEILNLADLQLHNNIIHRNGEAFLTACMYGNLEVLKKLFELTLDSAKQLQMTRENGDKALNMLMMLNQTDKDNQTHSLNTIYFLLSKIMNPKDDIHKFSLQKPTEQELVKSNMLSSFVIQPTINANIEDLLLLSSSSVEDLSIKLLIVLNGPHYEKLVSEPFQEIIGKDKPFIHKLVELKDSKSDLSPIKVLYSMEFAKNVFYLALVSKNILSHFPELATEKILSYLEPKNINLSFEEKKDTFNAIVSSHSFKAIKDAMENIMKDMFNSMFNNLPKVASVADQKVSFVDRLSIERSKRENQAVVTR